MPTISVAPFSKPLQTHRLMAGIESKIISLESNKKKLQHRPALVPLRAKKIDQYKTMRNLKGRATSMCQALVVGFAIE